MQDLKERFESEINFSGKHGTKAKCLIGVKHNLLTVIDYRRQKDKTLLWICKCDCGNVAYVRTELHLLRRFGCQSCTTSKVSPKRNTEIEHYTFYRRKFKEYRDGANKRHLSFELLFDDFLRLTQKPCYYCGISPSVKDAKYGNKVASKDIIFNGIDRKDSSKGYTLDNCVSACTSCNYGKHQKSSEEFYNWIQRVYNHYKGSTTIP